jgi:thymidylate kinase
MIFIEGLPCAGKSLLIKALEAQGESVCFELGKMLNRDDFPGNGQSLDEVELINHWFIRKESERMKENPSLFFDRSYLTHLCYAYAYSRWTSLDIFESTVTMYANKIVEGSLPKPERVIYVDICSQESIARQEKKMTDQVSRGLPAFWRSERFLDDTRYAYQKLFTSMTGIPVLSINAELNTKDKLKKLQRWLSSTEAQGAADIDCDSFVDKVRDGELL